MSTDSKDSRILVTGLCREAIPWWISALALDAEDTTASQRQLIVIYCSSNSEADTLAAELQNWLQWRGRSRDQLLWLAGMDNVRSGNQSAGERQQTLSQLLIDTPGSDGRRVFLVTTPDNLLAELPAPKAFDQNVITLNSGMDHPMQALLAALQDPLDYAAEALCEEPGQYAVRGGLIDVWPVESPQPFRIDFFGDTIESIRSFDPVTQRSMKPVEQIQLRSELTLSRNTGSASLWDYLNHWQEQWHVFHEPGNLVRTHPLVFDNALPKSNQATLASRMQKHDPGCHWIGLAEVDHDPAHWQGATRISYKTESMEQYRPLSESFFDAELGVDRLESGNLLRQRFESQLVEWTKRRASQLLFAVQTEQEGRELTQRLQENPICRKLSFECKPGHLSGGFRHQPDPEAHTASGNCELPLPREGCVVVTADEYFGRLRRRLPSLERPPARAERVVDHLLDFSELVEGDALIHLQHGLCLYRGLKQVEINGTACEVISVAFADEVLLHIPLHESHLLSRYVGLTKAAPKPAKLGGTQWERTRRQAEVATLDFAAQMLRMGATRAHATGHAFAADTAWQKSFEEAFPFKETPDQQAAIDATKRDMESTRPMDRLICGDVGFGKTEVALRAAMKAVMDGKQVAVLTPTTVLCQQHLQHFSERMAPFPVLLGSVSSFRTAAQNRATLADAAAGKLDIVIGTHRLLSKDVFLPRLGLVIIDEEQRFGVRQKERLKQLGATTDLLTLSATPIPRTLYMALAGARSMSVIETPPAERLPIQTIVRNYSDETIKSAIEAELERGGQVFYLHNRVLSIETVADRIRTLLPKARVAVGHGQMAEHQLERIMTRFVAGAFDVLVCTTIIESGLNIPNCNTLIIEGADRFGLAQLYQIRGRVGRHNRQAYAYLLLRRHAGLLESARKRLAALRHHNQLGAGFRIAMRDLELRGAGNLLGAEQSGHIAGVGFDLYCQLLRQSVSRLKGEPGSNRIRAEVRLDFVVTGEGEAGKGKVQTGTGMFEKGLDANDGKLAAKAEASIPAHFIREPQLRIDCYRRLAMAETCEQVVGIGEELADRFGKLPDATKILLAITRIRILAEQAGVKRVETDSNRLLCHRAKSGPGQGTFLQAANRFPRLTGRTATAKLKEIETFLKRHIIHS
jgi:transcription-repair coupling factor (superfamily II helicase)